MRHFYATQMLRKHVSIHALARQMGTSTEMLERFYSDFISTLTSDTFAGRIPAQNKSGVAKREPLPESPA